MDLKTLMHEALVEIFQIPQNWPEMENTLVSCTQTNKSRVSFVGPVNVSAQIRRILKRIQIRSHPISSACELEQDPNSFCKENHIAIVGMSGRFPGSDDIDAFWQVLSQGRELCQEVIITRLSTSIY